VSATLQKYLDQGDIRKYQGEFEVTVVNGLGVVEDRTGKKRPILDARYISAFDRYSPFHYEKLSEVAEYLGSEGCFMLTDLKSGYHQLKMHPDTYRFLCIEFGGQLYYFTHLPFGVSSACKTYTVLMSEVYRPLRQAGQRLTALMDDALFEFEDDEHARARALAIEKVMSALGFFFSEKKCQFQPVREGKFLG